jgi:hypothetical protein
VTAVQAASGPRGYVIAGTVSGAGGFTAAARFGLADGSSGAAVWISTDGANWSRSQVSGLTGGGSHAVAALAASGSAVTGIDAVQAQASQQFAVLNLPAR